MIVACYVAGFCDPLPRVAELQNLVNKRQFLKRRNITASE